MAVPQAGSGGDGAVRVLHLTATFPRRPDDTATPFLLDLLTAQRAAGWDAAAVALHDAGLPARHEVAGVPVRRVRYGPDAAEVLAYRGGLVHALPGGLSGRRSPLGRVPWRALLLPALVVALWAGVVGELRRHRPEVLHAHWVLPAGVVAALVPRRWRPRTVLTFHGTDVELAAGRLGVLARWALRRVDGLAAVSAPLARRAEAVLGLAAGTVAVAALPLPADLVPAPLPDGPRRVLAAGRASREKGLDVLLRALAEPAAAALSATVVTDGPERPALEALVAELGLAHRVALRGLVPRAELFALVREHHVVAVPSRAEGLGLVAVEALALGRPVVASAVGGLVAVVGEGDGALVPPEDPVALAAALADVPLVAPRATVLAGHGTAAVAAAHRALYRGDR